MARKSRGGNSYKTQYKAYTIKGQWRKNKIAKLTKRAIHNDSDNSAMIEFEKGSKTYGREKPGKKGWFHPQETAILKALKDADPDTAKALRAQLYKIQEIYADKRPSAVIRVPVQPKLPTLIVDQLFTIGIINEKRRNSAKARNRSISSRRTVSNRR